ncbi:hypothetical protein HS7_09920 [Sulfolobales archaeon HS-7]|nr:hypothetical protein HS7_09920 [Sulfolobales archaeon HS-7]
MYDIMLEVTEHSVMLYLRGKSQIKIISLNALIILVELYFILIILF